MTKPTIGLMVTAAEHFPYERPRELQAQAAAALRSVNADVIVADELVTNPATAEAAAVRFQESRIDLLVTLCGSFTWDNMPTRVAQELNVPIVLWGIPEPPMVGGRLEANSLVGVTMNAAALKRLGHRYKFVYGMPEEAAVRAEIARTMRVIGALTTLRHTRLGIVGSRPPGFYGSTYDELRLRQALGIEIIPIEVSEVLAAYDGASEEAAAAALERVRDLGRIAGARANDLARVARLYAGLRGLVDAGSLSGLAVKCWPELKDRMLNPCVVNSLLTDDGIMTGCETDVHGTISMLIEHLLTGEAAFFADLVTFDEAANTVLLWHCGAAPASLAARKQDVALERHSIGTGIATIEFPLRAGRVTFTRLGPVDDGYRLLIVTGEALLTGMPLRGNNILVRTDLPVRQVVERIIQRGVEHHYALVYGDLYDDLLELCQWAGLRPETLALADGQVNRCGGNAR
ncbi:MAG: L-fucose/L-arabinose isomerase family protein [Anaerolineae bacterium]